MQRCPLFGRCPLLGVSVNRESTVYPPHAESVVLATIIAKGAGPVCIDMLLN